MTPSSKHLQGQVVAITGAGQGLGRAYALAAAAAGAKVVVNDLSKAAAESTAADIEALGGSATAHGGAVQEAGVAEEIVGLAHSELGGLDGFVANAGVMHVRPAIEETYDELKLTIDVNLLGTMLCGVAAMREMIKQGHGSLVLVTSGARFGMRGISTYGATKAAVASLASIWAGEVAEFDVRVNVISPLANTPMTALNPDAPPTPEPEAIAPLVVYLLSDAAFEVRGQILRLDGQALSVYPSPANATPIGERPAWSVDEIAEAVRGWRSASPVG